VSELPFSPIEWADQPRFYIGSNIFDWPLQAMRALTDGHQICVHTWSHQSVYGWSMVCRFAFP
jgi:hypothetical protein